MVENNPLQFTICSHLESTKQKFLPASSLLFFLRLGIGGIGTSVMEVRSGGGGSISPSKSFLDGFFLKGVDIV